MSVQDRIEFTWQFAKLVGYARTLGFDIIIDEVRRGEQQADWNAQHCRVTTVDGRCERRFMDHGKFEHEFKPIGIRDSNHLRAVAGDVYIMEDGHISNDRDKYERLGVYWEQMDKDNRWGGNFEGFADLGHFERNV